MLQNKKYNISVINKIKNWYTSIDWFVFSFLILIINVNIKVKALGLILLLIYAVLHKSNIKKPKIKDIPQFYFLMIILSFVHYIFSLDYLESDVLVKTGIAIIYWSISLFIIKIIYIFIENNSIEKIKNALSTFFLLNISISLLNILIIIFKIQEINPFIFEGEDLKYQMSTGDYITGISFDSSYINAFICLYSFIYFLYEKKYIYSIASIAILLITNSNITNLILFPILLLFFINGTKLIRTYIIFCCGLIIIFYVKISPQSFSYMMNYVDAEYSIKQYHKRENDSIQKLRTLYVRDSIIEEYNTNRKASVTENNKADVNPNNAIITSTQIVKNETLNRTSTTESNKESIHSDSAIIDTAQIVKNEILNQISVTENSKEYIHPDNAINQNNNLNDQLLKEDAITKFISKTYSGNFNDSTLLSYKVPGKILSYYQTLISSISSVKFFLIGEGPGNFSSKLAFKLSGVQDSILTDHKYTHINKNFKENHLKIYCYYFNLDKTSHSILNTPYSSFNQILGEYGVVGILSFILFYAMFYLKKYQLLTFGKYLLLVTIQGLFIDYLFEGLSILVLFELLMFIDLKSNKIKNGN